MSLMYNEYLKQHRDNVIRGFNWIRENLPELLPNDENFNHLFNWHDFSKYDNEEYQAYDNYYYGGYQSDEILNNFNLAWLHHIHNNPHHWQFWVLINDDPNESEILLEIPYRYILEMICDWWSFSWKNGDLTEIFKWYDSHKNYIKMNEKSRKKLENILKKIKEKLEFECCNII